MGDDDVIPFAEEDPRPDPPPSGAPPPGPLEPEPSTPPHPFRYTFNDAFAVGWRGFGRDYPALLGATIVYAVLAVVAGFVAGLFDSTFGQALGAGFSFEPASWLVDLLITGPMGAGMLLLGALAARGDGPSFNDMFHGFRRYGAVVLTVAASQIVVIIALAPIGVIAIGMQGGATPGGLIAILAIVIIGWLVMLYFQIRWLPAAVLVVDPLSGEHSGIDALRVSWRMTQGHVLSLMGLGIVLTLIVIVCTLMLCLPAIFFAGPLVIAVGGAAYSMLAHQHGVAPIWTYEDCPYCGYDLRDTPGDRCPECGHATPGSDDAAGMRPIVF